MQLTWPVQVDCAADPSPEEEEEVEADDAVVTAGVVVVGTGDGAAD